MKNLFTVIKFTIKEIVRKKSFIISTILILSLIVVGFSIPKIVESITNGKKDKIIISDENNLFEGNLAIISKMDFSKYDLKIENLSKDELKKKVENEEIHSAIIVNGNNEEINMTYLVQSTLWDSAIPQEILEGLETVYSNMQIEKLGISKEKIAKIQPNFSLNIEQTKDEEVNEGNIFIMMGVSFALSIAIIFFTAQVSTSITTEKTSKIMETLVTSTTPRTIVLGKTIGIGIIGLLQVILVIGTALISANIFLDNEMINAILDMSNITPSFILITISYFILGYFAYALLYALTGSLVSKPEDIQSANTPVSLIAMIGFYLGYFSIAVDPTSSISSFASLFPISSAFCMPSRVMMGLASGWDVAISIILLLVMVIIIAKVAIKVYSNAILNYGSKMSLKDALKMYKEK